MRLNQTHTSNDIINLIKNPNINNDCQKKIKTTQEIFTKKQLWNIFLYEFKLMFGVSFIDTEQNTNNIKALFYYFLDDDAFFTCNNVKTDISKPSFKKGLMVVGGYGIGKTAYFKVFEKIFKSHSSLRFTSFGAKELVNKYEVCLTSVDKSYMINQTVRPGLSIDDINSERTANNFGKCEVIEEILFMQNEKKYRTFVTCNHTNPENNIEQTLLDLGKRYGGRSHDRFFEMFNIIEFTGKSMRR